MHSVSPYTIRCFNPNVKGANREDHYSPLGSVGQFDAYVVLRDFIKSRIDKYELIEDSQQIYRFHNFNFDDGKRQFHGFMQAGTYGLKTNIININTGKVDFKKAQHNAEMLTHYIRFFVPKDLNEGIVLLHNIKNVGIKTILYSIMSKHFNDVTKRVLQMNPLAYEKAYKEWEDAVAKEVKLTKFKGLANIEDQVDKLGHCEQELIFKATRKKNLGTLKDYFTPGSEQLAAIEVLTPLCAEVKTVVEIGGRKRTFRIGSNPSQQICEIELDETEVPVDAGVPDARLFAAWCRKLLLEFARTIYPKVKVEI